MIKKIENSSTINVTSSGNDLKSEYSPSFTDKQNIKIKRAILKLPISNINSSLNYEVCNIVTNNSVEEATIIDCFKNASSNNLVCIDISDELQDVLNNNQDKLTLKIKNAVNNITLSNGSEVIIDLFSKKQKINNSDLKVNCKRAGQGSINLATGIFQFVHNDIVSDKKVLPIKIDHVYNSFLSNKTNDSVENNPLPDFNCSYGWKLNAQQYLIKEKILIS